MYIYIYTYVYIACKIYIVDWDTNMIDEDIQKSCKLDRYNKSN